MINQCLFILLLIPFLQSKPQFIVNPENPTSFPSIQSALNAAKNFSSESIIEISIDINFGNHYRENLDLEDLPNVVLVPDGFEMRGGDYFLNFAGKVIGLGL